MIAVRLYGAYLGGLDASSSPFYFLQVAASMIREFTHRICRKAFGCTIWQTL